jgi:hypothetical protein
MWAIGDQLNDDPGALPKLKAQFCYSDKTVEEAKRMSSRFPRSERNLGVTFSHHQIVATFNKETRRRLLKRAANEKLSIRELRAEVERAAKSASATLRSAGR